MFVAVLGGVMAMLPTYRGLDFDLGSIPLMDLAPRATCHPLVLGEGGEGCRGTGGSLLGGVLGPSQPAPPGGRGGGRGTDSAVSPPPLLLQGLA